MIAVAQLREREHLAANLRRLMARFTMSQADVVQATGLDERTIRGVLNGLARPHAVTIGKLAAGLGVDEKELLADPEAPRVKFDRDTQAILADYVNEHPALFKQWTDADMQDLASRFALGGPMTLEGIERAVETITMRREAQAMVAVVAETSGARIMFAVLRSIYDQVVIPSEVVSHAAESHLPIVPPSDQCS